MPEPEEQTTESDKRNAPSESDKSRSPESRPDAARVEKREFDPAEQKERSQIAKPERTEDGATIGHSFGKADLTNEAKQQLDRVAATKLQSGDKIFVGSYASRPGGTDTNQLLSDQRSFNVASYLESKGVPPEKIQRTGYGENGAEGQSEHNDNRNDRVTVVEVRKEMTDRPPPRVDPDELKDKAISGITGQFEAKQEVKPQKVAGDIVKEAATDLVKEGVSKGKLPTPGDLAKVGATAGAKFLGEALNDGFQKMETISKIKSDFAPTVKQELGRLAMIGRLASQGKEFKGPDTPVRSDVDRAAVAAAREMYGKLTVSERGALNELLTDKRTGPVLAAQIEDGVRSALLQKVGTEGGGQRSRK